jgi:hypothetical protein
MSIVQTYGQQTHLHIRGRSLPGIFALAALAAAIMTSYELLHSMFAIKASTSPHLRKYQGSKGQTCMCMCSCVQPEKVVVVMRYSRNVEVNRRDADSCMAAHQHAEFQAKANYQCLSTSRL